MLQGLQALQGLRGLLGAARAARAARRCQEMQGLPGDAVLMMMMTIMMAERPRPFHEKVSDLKIKFAQDKFVRGNIARGKSKFKV